MGERRFCYRCMEKYDMDQHICPHCGFDDRTPSNPMYITPGTVLRDRYLVGELLEYNGEGATYVGQDLSTDCKVMLREYMPVDFCTRVKNKATISVNYNNLAKYKAFMAEYTELNKSLARLRNNSNINPILDMFADNNTTYTVFEYIEGIKMLDFLKDNAGELSWEQVSRLFPTLFTTIGILHNAGIIHRAISPETVFITTKGELKLSSFCISAVRTADAGLEYELYKGYAAPEQYSASSSSRQGSWTDVYGVCALLYRSLTGCMPVDSLSRMKHDDLCEPAMLNSSIPEHVSKTIMDGMRLNGSDRIQTITELVTKLFEQPVQVKPVVPVHDHSAEEYSEPEYYDERRAVPPQDMEYRNVEYRPPERDSRQVERRRFEEPREEKVNTVDRLKVPVIIGILLLAILLIIGVFIMNMLRPATEDDETFSRHSGGNITDEADPDATGEGSDGDTEVPDLIGDFLELTEKNYSEYFKFEITEVYNDEAGVDVIIEQEPDPGSFVPKGSTIKLTVSKGKEGGTIPDYSGLTLSQYENKLKEAGITNYSKVESSNQYGTPDSISSLQVNGVVVKAGDYFSNKDGKKLIIYYIPQGAIVAPTVGATEAPTEAATQAATEAHTQPPTEAPTEPPVIATDPPYVEPTDSPVVEPDSGEYGRPGDYGTW
ncbi:MAG: PASTA domain-containing protein [Ruminococcus sp.]|nr:PASTA domain-containing protein [Ruminococcus sp.]